MPFLIMILCSYCKDQKMPTNGKSPNGGGVPMQTAETERKHYMPEFSAADPKWRCWPAQQHVQKAASMVSVATALVGLVVLLVVLLLLRPLYLRLFVLALCLLMCAVSALALLANLRQHQLLFLPYLYFLWFLNILCFTLFFFLLPMIVVPQFWHGWVLVGFGMDPNQRSDSVVRLITVAGAFCAFALLCVLTLFNFTVLRARNFVLAKRTAKVHAAGGAGGNGAEMQMVTKAAKEQGQGPQTENEVPRNNGNERAESTRRVRVVDTVA